MGFSSKATVNTTARDKLLKEQDEKRWSGLWFKKITDLETQLTWLRQQLVNYLTSQKGPATNQLQLDQVDSVVHYSTLGSPVNWPSLATNHQRLVNLQVVNQQIKVSLPQSAGWLACQAKPKQAITQLYADQTGLYLVTRSTLYFYQPKLETLTDLHSPVQHISACCSKASWFFLAGSDSSLLGYQSTSIWRYDTLARSWKNLNFTTLNQRAEVKALACDGLNLYVAGSFQKIWQDQVFHGILRYHLTECDWLPVCPLPDITVEDLVLVQQGQSNLLVMAVGDHLLTYNSVTDKLETLPVPQPSQIKKLHYQAPYLLCLTSKQVLCLNLNRGWLNLPNLPPIQASQIIADRAYLLTTDHKLLQVDLREPYQVADLTLNLESAELTALACWSEEDRLLVGGDFQQIKTKQPIPLAGPYLAWYQTPFQACLSYQL